MLKKSLVTAIILALAVSFAVSAAESGSAKGRWASHFTSVDTVELPGGGSVRVAHSKQFSFADDSGHPSHNTASDCVGVARADADGNVTSASGSCFGADGEGNGVSWWWRQDESGTEGCPTACGSWGYFDGSGKYKGISGSGTWVVATSFADGNNGNWEGSYSIP